MKAITSILSAMSLVVLGHASSQLIPNRELKGVLIARSTMERPETDDRVLVATTESEVRERASQSGLLLLEIHDGVALLCPPSELDPDRAVTNRAIIDALIGVAANNPVHLSDVSPDGQAAAKSILQGNSGRRSLDSGAEVCLTTNTVLEISDGHKTVKFLHTPQPDQFRKVTEQLRNAVAFDARTKPDLPTMATAPSEPTGTLGLTFLRTGSKDWKRNDYLASTEYFAKLILEKSLAARAALDRTIDEGLKKLRPDLASTDERQFQGKRMGDVPKKIGDEFSRYLARNWEHYGFESQNSAEVFARGASVKGVKQTIYLSFGYKGPTGADVIINAGLN
jgi:hypothetical protein